jgi:hypothetical protein
VNTMDISVKALEEAVSIRRQIDKLERRLASILGAAPTKPAPIRKKGELTRAGRRRLAQAMKARWATRKNAGRLMKAHWTAVSDTVPPPRPPKRH